MVKMQTENLRVRVSEKKGGKIKEGKLHNRRGRALKMHLIGYKL